MTALDQWLSRRKDATPAQEMWSLAFPAHRVLEVQQMPRQMRDDGGYVEKGYAVLLAGPGQQAGAWFPAFEPAAAWARSGRQSGSYSSLEMRQASRVVRNIDGTGVDEYALLLGDHLQRDDDACRRWAQHLNAQSSHWTG
jgi:hypothetical protein